MFHGLMLLKSVFITVVMKLVNPFQNMFEVVDDSFMETMSHAANVTLSRLQSEEAHDRTFAMCAE